MTDRTAEQQAAEASERRTELPERLVDSIRRHGSEALMIAARVTKQRLDEAQTARKPREAESLAYSEYLAAVAPNSQLLMENPQGRAARELREAGQSVATRRTLALLRARAQAGGNR